MQKKALWRVYFARLKVISNIKSRKIIGDSLYLENWAYYDDFRRFQCQIFKNKR
jgi:hypothetical protein